MRINLNIVAMIVGIAGVAVLLWPLPSTNAVDSRKLRRQKDRVVAPDLGKMGQINPTPNAEQISEIPGKIEDPENPFGGGLTEDGVLSYQVVRDLGLSDSQAIHAQRSIESLWEAMSALEKQHAEQIEPPDGGDADRTFFVVEPFADESMPVKEQFSEKLRQALDPEQTDSIANALLAGSYFGSFGRNRVMIGFEDTVGVNVVEHFDPAMGTTIEEGEHALRATIVTSDPDTGQILLQEFIPYEDFLVRYGTAFVLDPEPSKAD